LLALAAGLAGALALLAILLPGLAEALLAARPEASWYVLRASGLLAYGLLWLTMLAGLGVTSGLARRWPGLPGSYTLHRLTSLLGLGCALVHALALLADPYVSYGVGQAFVPFLSGHYRAAWVGLGQVALYLLAVVGLSFYLRDRLGIHAWRLIHMLSFALFLLALIHGLESGSDSGSLWGRALYWVSGGSVLLGASYRVLARRRGRRKEGLAPTGLIAAGGRAPAPRPALVVTEGPAGRSPVWSRRHYNAGTERGRF
jgi:predicted ferric reductase